jgi:hypothetical protein
VYYLGHKIVMRKTALCAGIAQLLYGTYAVAPELFGVGRMPVPNQFLDWLASISAGAKIDQ